MDSFLGLIGSIVIGGLFLLGVMTFYGDTVIHSHEKLFEIVTQETTASYMEIINDDLEKLGSGVTFPATSIIDTSEITFLGDVDEDGVVDTVRYFTSLPSAATSTANPNDVILYRIVNGVTTIDLQAGILDFDVTLLDRDGIVIDITHPDPNASFYDTRSLHVSLSVESLSPYDDRYTTTIWERVIVPQNLSRISDKDFW